MSNLGMRACGGVKALVIWGSISSFAAALECGQDAAGAQESEGPCAWSARWNEHHTAKPVAFSESIQPEKLLHVDIAWPSTDVGHSGVPLIEFIIGPNGIVEEARFLKRPVFRPAWTEGEQAILDALYEWQYESTVINGVAVPVCVTMTINICWS